LPVQLLDPGRVENVGGLHDTACDAPAEIAQPGAAVTPPPTDFFCFDAVSLFLFLWFLSWV
jgi:hypothetical protein